MKNFFFVLLFFTTHLFFAQKNERQEYLLAENYFRNNQYEKAATIFKKLTDKNKYNTTYLKRLITCYQEVDSFALAEKTLLRKLDENPKLVFINVLLGQNFERQHQQEKATKYYNKALASIDKKAGYGSSIASLFKNYTKLDLALSAYKKLMKIHPKANYGFQMAQIYGEKGNFALMFESYIDYLDKNKSLLNTVKRYTAKYITDDSENENNILFKKALLRRSASNPKEEWNDLLSWLFTKQKEYNKAFIQQKALYVRNSDNLGGIRQLGKISFENKDYETAKKCFDFVIEKTNYPQDKFSAISFNLLIGVKTEQPNIEEEFQQVFTEYGINKNTLPAQLVYANYLTFVKNNAEKAREVLEKALTLTANKYVKANVKLRLADVLVYQGKFNKALIYYSQVQTQLKNHTIGQQARFKVAQTSYFKNDFKWAKAQLKVLKGSATKLIANDAAALFLIISDNQGKDSLPTGLAKYAKADLLAYQNKDKEAIAILGEVITDFKGQPIEDEALFKQAKLLVKQKKYDEAILNYANIIALDKEGIYVDDVYYQMAELYKNELNNVEKAKEYYQKIIFEYSNSIYLVEARKKYRKLRGDDI